jgi:hypothetical protein
MPQDPRPSAPSELDPGGGESICESSDCAPRHGHSPPTTKHPELP